MADIAQKIDPSRYYKKTGLALSTTWIVTKILWVRNNEPKTWDKVCKVVQVQDFFLRHLGADSYYVDYPDACLFGCFDNEKNVWDKELLELCEIDEILLPIPTPCATRIGVVSENASLRTGLKAGTPICVGAGDQNSASVGAGVIKKGIVSVSLGTGGMAIAYLDKPYRDPKSSVCVTSHPIIGAYQFEGYQIAATSVFKWFKDEIAGIENAYAKSVNENVYALLDNQIKNVPVGSNGLLLMPYFGSSASPKWNPNARGVLLGLTLAHNRACVARAFMEGITLEQKDIITNMRSNGIKINSIRIMGGATNSEIWNQMQADMYDLTCETLVITDAAILGAAIMAGVAIGEFKSIEQAVNSMVKVDKKYEPNKNNVKIYDELFDIYCETYKGLTEYNVYDKISRFQELYK